MARSDDKPASDFALEAGPPRAGNAAGSEKLSFLEQGDLDAESLRRRLRAGDREERALLVSQILSYAPWDEIWTYIDRDQARDLFPDLELSEGLRSAWARMLGIDPRT
ncbi:MAG: hypothetical protein MI919_11905 [Holophagales bacterium]|nr:hypothetical protein [Holophagales bacterium]